MAVNTTPLNGKLARIYDNATAVGYSTAWNITANCQIVDASRQGQHWEEKNVGMGSWSGTMNYILLLNDTQQKAFHDKIFSTDINSSAEAVKFYIVSGGSYYSGSIYFNSAAVAASIGSVVTLNMSFTGTGVIAFTA